MLRVGEFERTFEDELVARYEIAKLPEGRERAEFLSEHAADIRVVLTSGPPGVDADTIEALPNLEVIINNGAGLDSIDLEAAKRRGIGVSNTPDVLSDTVADTALGLILMTLRRFGAADRFVRAGRWARDGQFPYARDVSGLQVGILGLGRIGSAIAVRLLGFDCATRITTGTGLTSRHTAMRSRRWSWPSRSMFWSSPPRAITGLTIW